MKRLLPFLLVLTLVACEDTDKSSDAVTPVNPDTTEKCVLTEMTYDDSNVTTGDLRRSKYTYDAAGRIVEIEEFLEGTRQGHQKVSYDAKGNIKRRDFYNTDNTLIRTTTFKYNAENLQTEASLYTLSDGKMELAWMYSHEYSSATQLKSTTAGQPQHNISIKYDYAYRNGLMYRIYSYDEFTRQTIELEYDDKKQPASTNRALLASFFNPEGFPFKHNITKATVIESSYETTPYVRNTTAFVYNEEGYPTQEVITKPNGTLATYTYGFQCK